jgi:hypothetical protein
VRNSTGYGGDRTCDAIAMSLWQSRGLELHGFEIKCSRGDWLSEMRRPDKADKMFKYFDRWWLAVSDASVVNDYELPPTWGLIVMDKIKVQAPILTPEPLDRKFLAAIMRRVYETSPESALDAAFARGKAAGADWTYIADQMGHTNLTMLQKHYLRWKQGKPKGPGVDVMADALGLAAVVKKAG